MVGGTITERPVILVDDEAAVREPLARALVAALPCVVHQFSDGPSALAATAGTEIGLALLDVNMSPMSGPELARELRRRSEDLPVLFLTGSTEEDLADALSESGPAAVLRKPVAINTLVALINQHRHR